MTVVTFIAAGWQYCVIAVWTFAVFFFFEGRTTPATAVPMLAWAYGTVMGPLSYMASKDPGLDSAPTLALLFTFVACVSIGGLYMMNVAIQTAIVGLVVLVLAASVFNAVMAGLGASRHGARQNTSDAQTSPLGCDLHRAMSQVFNTDQ